MRRRKKVFQEESGLDLTPMLDIVFIMLIEMKKEIFLLPSLKIMKFILIEERLSLEQFDQIS